MAQRAHAPLAPSASGIWTKCHVMPAYVDALLKRKLIKKRPDNESAQRGTRIHGWGEQFIRWMLLDKSTDKIKGAEDELEEAHAYAQHCVSLIEDERVFSKKVMHGVEDRAQLHGKWCWGSRDFWMYANGILRLRDLKTGRVPVEIVDCTQLLIYAVDLFEKFNPHQVEIGIFQPNANDGQGPIRTHAYTADDMQQWAHLLRNTAETAAGYFGEPIRKLERKAVAGNHCDYCDAAGVCPAKAAREVEFMQKNSFKAVSKSAKAVAAPVFNFPSAEKLDGKQIAEILNRAPAFVDWLEEIKLHALEILQDGRKVPGWKTVAKQTRYAFKKDLTHAKIAALLKVRVTDITEIKLLAPSKVKEKLPKLKKKLIDKVLWRPIEYTIAPEADRRPAIHAVASSFKPVSRKEVNDDGK